MTASLSILLCVLSGLRPLVQASHLCNYGVHYFVEYKTNCAAHPENAEMFGCDLFDFAHGKPFKHLERFEEPFPLGIPGTVQVHWYGQELKQDAFYYVGPENEHGHSTCVFFSHCNATGKTKATYSNGTIAKNQACIGNTHEEFNVPDYCARAITSELSTVYNGVDRVPGIRAAAKVALTSTKEYCFGYIKERVLADIFKKGKAEKACWNHVNDWRRLYCVKYNKCKCPEGVTGMACNEHQASVDCCKVFYNEFLDSKHFNSIKDQLGYPMKLTCKDRRGHTGCEQSEFGQLKYNLSLVQLSRRNSVRFQPLVRSIGAHGFELLY